MADGTIGWSDFAGTDYSGSTLTLVGKIAAAQATKKGALYKFDCRMQAAATVKVKVFRDDGTNYLFIGQESFSLSIGLNSNIKFTSPIRLEAGDMIGFYGGGVRVEVLTGGCDYKIADVEADSLKSGWSAYNYKLALKGYIRQYTGAFTMFLFEAWDRHKELWTPKLLIPEGI